MSNLRLLRPLVPRLEASMLVRTYSQNGPGVDVDPQYLIRIRIHDPLLEMITPIKNQNK